MKLDMLWGVFDQALQSLVNLSVGFLLIYFESKANYGLYGLGFAALLLSIGFSNAIVSTQMTVIAPSKTEGEQGLFCMSLIIGFFSLFIPLIIVFLFGYEYFANKYGLVAHKEYIYTLVLVSPGLIFLEIMRRYFYLKLTPKKVFMMDVFYVSIYASGLYFIIHFNLENKYIYTIAVNGIAAIFTSITFFIMSDLKLKGAVKNSRKSFKEAWVGGKWSLGGVMVSWVQNQGYVYVLGLSKGSELVAEANAARLFLAPIGVLSASISKVIMPRLVKLKVKGQIKGAVLIMRKVLLLLLSFIVVYVTILNVYLDLILEAVMKNKYQMVSGLILCWSLYFFCQAFRNNNSILLQVFRLFKKITVSSFFTSILVLTISLVAIDGYGVQGVILTMCFGELILATIFWNIFRNEYNKY